MQAAQGTNHTLKLHVQSAKFVKDTDWFGKMDPFVRVTIGNDIRRTETAKDKGKNPTWTTVLTFKITQEQYNLADTVGITLEAYDEDSETSAEFLGRVTQKLSQIKPNTKHASTLTVKNEKNKDTGTLQVEFELTLAPVTTQKPQETNPTKPVQDTSPTKPNQDASPTKPQQATIDYTKKLIGTVMIRPAEGKFDAITPNKQTLTLSFLHHGITCQTPISEKSDSKLLFHNPVIFQLYEGEDMSVRCVDSDPKNPGVIGEGNILLTGLIKKGNLQIVPVELSSRIKKLGNLNLEVEFFTDVFENPVKMFPPISIKKGQSQNKKVKYSNLDNVAKSIKVKSQNKNLVLIKTETLTIQPHQAGEIKFELFAPQGQEEKCRVDIVVESTRAIEESILFKLKGV